MAAGTKRGAAVRPPIPGRASTNRYLDLLIVLLLPVIQIGVSYYVAIATFLAILVVYRERAALAPGVRQSGIWLLCLPGMLLSLLEQGGDDPLQDLLRIVREGLCFALILLIVRGTAVRPSPVQWPRLLRLFIMLSGALLLLSLVQFVALRGGRYVGIPATLYAQGGSTIPTELALRYSALRPSATLSEPSYLAFVLLSILLPVTVMAGRRSHLVLLVGLCAVCGLVSQAASFILFGALLAFVAIERRATLHGKGLLLTGVVLGATFLVAFASDVGVLARLSGGTQFSGDASIFVRIFGPLQILPNYLVAHPLGMPFSAIEDYIRPDTERLGIPPLQFLMNGLFNLFFEFGIVGLPILVGLLAIRDGVVRTYLVAAMMFNGSFLAPDKVAVVGFSVAIYHALLRHRRIAATAPRRLPTRVRRVAVPRPIPSPTGRGTAMRPDPA